MSRTQRWTCSQSPEVHTTVSAQISAISAWWHNFWGKYETICPVFKNHLCNLFSHQFLPRKHSTNMVFFLLSAIFPITEELQHNFLRHRELSHDLLTVSSIRCSELENATFWSAKNITKISFGQNLFFSGVSYVLNNRKKSKNFSFQWHFKTFFASEITRNIFTKHSLVFKNTNE